MGAQRQREGDKAVERQGHKYREFDRTTKKIKVRMEMFAHCLHFQGNLIVSLRHVSFKPGRSREDVHVTLSASDSTFPGSVSLIIFSRFSSNVN